MKRRPLLIGASALAVASLGIGWKRSSPKDQPLPEIKTAPLSEFNENIEYDVCVVGSGPAGCALAQQLLSEGLSVLMLESGPSLTDVDGMQRAFHLDAYESSGAINYPIQGSRVRALGGTSNIWTGRCPRLLPSDFAGNPLSPAGGWPISYSTLLPYYQQAEKLLRVSGEELTAGHAPRQQPLPYQQAAKNHQLRALLKPLTIDLNKPPTSSDETIKGPVRFAHSFIPNLLKQPGFHLFSDATATKVEVDLDGHSPGITVRSTQNDIKLARAKHYVLAGGALETTRLLLLSQSVAHPTGLGNQSDHLGRYFMEHPFVGYTGKLPGYKLTWRRSMGRTYQFTSEMNNAGLGDVLVGFYSQRENRLKIALGIEMSPEKSNRISLSETVKDAFGNPGLNLSVGHSDQDQQLFSRGEDLVNNIFDQLSCKSVEKRADNHWSHHHIGTTRMSNNPADGVVDSNLKIHGTNNVYVASSSVFVTSGVANPTLTIVALSLRLADHLLSKGMQT